MNENYMLAIAAEKMLEAWGALSPSDRTWPTPSVAKRLRQSLEDLEMALRNWRSEGTKSGGVSESVREQQRGLPHWPDSLHAAWFKWSSTPAYAGFLRDVPIQLRPCALRFVQAAFEEAAKLPPKPNCSED